MKLLEIKHLDVDGKVLWEDENIPNTFHYEGEEFLLKVAFNTASLVEVPANYYVGLDNRTSIVVGNTLAGLTTEPNSGGYSRQSVNSINGFVVQDSGDGNKQAISTVLTFTATGSGYGPIKNVFLTNVSGSSGYLLSSAALSASRSLTAGQVLTVRVAVTLRNC